MLAGCVPFDADTSMGILMKHISKPPPPIEGLPVALQNVLERALAKKPADRYNSAGDLTRAFLEAADLHEAEIANGYRVTSTPAGTANGIPAPSDERATVPPTPQSVVSPSVVPQPKVEKRRFQPWLVVVPVILLLIVTFALSRFFPAALPTAQSPHDSAGKPMQMDSKGLLRFYDVSGILDEVILTSDKIPQAPAGFQYEAWLVGGESRRSLGIFSPDANGKGELNFLDEQGRNLLVRYSRLEITLEENPDKSPNPSGKVVYSSGIPSKALTHIRHLLVSYDDTPKEIGLLVGLMNDVSLLDASAAAMVEAYDKKDAAGVRKNAEAISNLLIGSQGKGYGDLDSDGAVNEIGDGYGLLLNGENLGYIEGTLKHAQLAMQMTDASTNIEIHGEHVILSAKNIEDWATELLPKLQPLLADPLSADSGKLVREIAALADRMHNGRDLNGNEQIEPIPGEGGAKPLCNTLAT
jgi:hypothetical protein